MFSIHRSLRFSGTNQAVENSTSLNESRLGAKRTKNTVFALRNLAFLVHLFCGSHVLEI